MKSYLFRKGRIDWTFAIIFALTAPAFCIEVFAQDFQKELWLEDFAQVKREMSSHYANLDWAIEKRKLDLKQLSENTESRIKLAKNETDAKRGIEYFLNAFGDGHLSIQWTEKNQVSTLASPEVAVQASLCDRLGFRALNKVSKTPLSVLTNYSEIATDDSKYFSIGLLSISSKVNIGVIRLSAFNEYAFPDLCEQVSAAMKLSSSSLCDDACSDEIERKAANLLTAALERQIEVLKKSNINYLIVDITGNGGGTNWLEAVARTLSPKPLHSPRQQFIRHSHWMNQLQNRLKIVEDELQNATQANKPKLVEAAGTLRKAIAESKKIYDRSGVWENKKNDYSLVADSPSLYPQSIFAYVKPNTLPNKLSSEKLFYPSRYKYTEGVYAGPLIVLVDKNTWSSAEYFAAMLKDNNAATIIGEPTGGAGCGYTNGGIRTVLKNSGATVKIPDCVRLRADGSNEVEGITPDVLIPWRLNDSPYQKAKRILDSLSAYVEGKEPNSINTLN